ncbi:MAG TPA: DNA/RNA non-specific endonuclease [Steroidobacteraceae bacterium]|jgi:DNA/RNA endonuclease G (NUC1)|nr:DNA/RNA non-specific endonuclease [Steroidobacteraceae bacterium]
MRLKNLRRWLLAAAALTLGSFATAQVRISEIHYDNTGADVGESVEVSAPAGTDLTGWRVVLYNGSGGASYGTLALSGVVPATCDLRGVVVVPAVGMQNGSPDGLALVDAGGALVEFLSYEGVFAATNGVANGITSTDIVAFQNGNGPVGESLARNAAGVWSLGTNTFGACNDNGATPPAPEVATVSVAPASATLNVGASLPLNATAFDVASAPINGVTFTWTSTNPAAATVSATGVATALADGDTQILATAANGVAGSSLLHVTTPTTPPASDFHFNEIHYDNLGTDAGEAIEIEGPAGADVTGFTIVLYNGNGGVPYGLVQPLSGTIPASCGTRGVLAVTYPPDGIQNGSPDGMALVNASGQVLEFLSYEGVFAATSGPAAGLSSTDILASQTNAAPGTSLQRSSSNQWAPGASNFGACNPEEPTPEGNSLQFSGRVPADPALPVGFEDQLFARLVAPGNVTVPTTITWASETPAIASIDQAGVMRALTVGTATFRATATDGTTATYSLPTRVAVASGVTYPGNTEFGEPADADANDDIIVRHEQFTASYNPNRGSPNWVSYDLDAAHFGPEDRCDCFTMDPDLPASLPRISTDDYTNAGAIAGYGIDRGHMTRSFDRTTGSLDNARTYLFSNVVPQASEMNQGPWANLENDLGDLARVQGKEVYIITGPAGNKGTLKNLGRVVIPTSTWKVAVILPHDHGLADITDYRDLEVIAVNMPNEPGVRNVDWNTYRTTVDAIEALTGYDLLALLPDDVEAAVESNTQPPIVAIAGPAGAIAEGDSATFSASGSLDPNGSVVGYAWDFGDGSTGSGLSVTHTFTQDGAFIVRLTVTDNDGLTATKTFTVQVSNVAPVVSAVPNATLNVGATYTVTGTFADPGADAWTATVNWGDGSAPEQVALGGHSFSLTHIYTAGGTYIVTVAIADDDAVASGTHSVTVTTPAPTLASALPLIDQLVATGKMPRAVGTVLKAEILAAQLLIGRGNQPAASVLLRATVAEIDVLVRLKVVKAADVAGLRSLLLQNI